MTGRSDASARRRRILDKIMVNVTVEAEPRPGQKTPCWIWTGPDSGTGRGGGYPRMKLDGQTVAVHRVIFTHFAGYIPGRKQIDHTCTTRRCVSPAHLEMVTHLENMKRRDRAARKDGGRNGKNRRAAP